MDVPLDSILENQIVWSFSPTLDRRLGRCFGHAGPGDLKELILLTQWTSTPGEGTHRLATQLQGTSVSRVKGQSDVLYTHC